MLYCCKTGNILDCRRRIAVWNIPEEILLMFLAQDLSCSIFLSLGQYTSRRRWRRPRERNFGRMQQEQSWLRKQGVQEHGQEAVCAQSSIEENERVCVCPFSYVTSKVMGRNNLSLCSQQVYEETLTYSKGVLDFEENFLIVRRVRHWRRLTGKGAGGCVISPGSFPGWVKVACVLYSFSLLI